MTKSRPYWIYALIVLAVLAAGVFFLNGHLQESALHEVMFRHGYWDDGSDEEKAILSPLGIGVDLERENRYQAIYDALKINPDLKLSRLDQAVPLPPAKLPNWSGVEDAITPESTDRPTHLVIHNSACQHPHFS